MSRQSPYKRGANPPPPAFGTLESNAEHSRVASSQTPSPIPAPVFNETSSEGGEYSEDSSAFEAVGLGLREDDEVDEVTREDRRKYRQALDELSPRDRSALKHRFVPSAPPTTKEIREVKSTKSSAKSERNSAEASSAPTFLIVFALVVLVAVLGFLARGFLSFARGPHQPPLALADLLHHYFAAIGFESQNEDLGYEANFRTAFRVFSCSKPHTILFLTPKKDAAKRFLHTYLQNFYPSTPSLFIDGNTKESDFASKLEDFFGTSLTDDCPSQFLVVDTTNGISETNRNLLEPALDDTHPVIHFGERRIATPRAVVILLREFSRGAAADWRAPLVQEWTGRFVQRLRNVVGWEAKE